MVPKSQILEDFLRANTEYEVTRCMETYSDLPWETRSFLLQEWSKFKMHLVQRADDDLVMRIKQQTSDLYEKERWLYDSGIDMKCAALFFIDHQFSEKCRKNVEAMSDSEINRRVQK